MNLNHKEFKDGFFIYRGKQRSNKTFSEFNGYAIVFVFFGKLCIEIEKTKLILNCSSCLLIGFNQPYQIHEDETQIDYFHIIFSSDFAFNETGISARIFMELFALSKTNQIEFAKENFNKILDTLGLLYAHFNQPDALFYNSLIRLNFSMLLLELASVYYSDKCTAKPGWRNGRVRLTIDFYELAIEHFSAHKNLQFYADKKSVSTGHLSRVIKEITGKPPAQIIDEFIVQETHSQHRI